MARTGRVVLPAYPHHVIQRGHNQQACFAESADYERYLATLAEFKEKLGVKVYAWCLMTNYVHLLLEPSTATSLALLMKQLSGRQLNPVRACIVAAPEAYPWSSCRVRLGYARSTILDLDPCYQELAAEESMRRERYVDFLHGAIPEGEWALIRTAVQRGQLTGNEAFREQIAATLHRRIENRGPGRPARK